MHNKVACGAFQWCNNLNNEPMGDIDEKASRSVSDEELFYDGVIQGDAELLYIDSYLSELF